MHLLVAATGEGHRLRCDDGPVAVVADVGLANKFLKHLFVRCFSPATVRAYAYDLLNFLRFLAGRRATLADVLPTDLFDYLDWQQQPPATAGVRVRVVRLADRRGAAPASVNRRVAAGRGLFEYAVTTGARVDNPVPAGRRSSGLRAKRRGLLADLGTYRDRAIVLLMALGGLRAAGVRSLRLADVDMWCFVVRRPVGR